MDLIVINLMARRCCK